MQEKQINYKTTSEELDFIKKGTGIIKKIVTALTIFILLGLPVFVWDKYFDILKAKYRFYFISVLVMLVSVGIFCIYWGRKDFILFKGNYLKSLRTRSWKDLKLSVTDISVLTFTLVAAISTLQSDFLYESFWGNEGRFNGLFLTLLYCATYFLISRYVSFRRWMLDAFFVVSLFICIWGILNFFRLDPFYFKRDLVSDDWIRFTSTIGNINTYTAFVSLFMGASTILFISAESWKYKIWYYLCMAISFYAIITGISDNAYLAIGALMGFVPFYAFRTWRGCRRYLIVVATLFTVMFNISWICEMWPANVMEFSSILKIVADVDVLKMFTYMLWVICVIWMILVFKKNENGQKTLFWPRALWLCLCIIVLSGISYVLYDANWGGNADKYSSYAKYLIFNDDWGTHRMYNWKLGLGLYKEFPWMHKIFGYGPDTYGILTIFNRYDEMTSRYNEVFENIHNEYLQYLITIGPIGMVAYISVIISSISTAVKHAADRPWVIACAFAILCYAVQAVVNIAQAITTPVLWTLLALTIAGCREYSKKVGEGNNERI